MAVKNSNRATNVGSSQRFAIGANVLLSVVLAVGLLIAVNLIASIKSYRSDLASVGNYGLSDRTKNVLGSLQKDVKLSLLYEPDEGDKAQQERITRMLDYCAELSRYSNKVTYQHVTSDRQRESLVAEINKNLSSEADAHKIALEDFERVRGRAEADLVTRYTEAQAILANNESWLGGFPLFTQVSLALDKLKEASQEAAEEIAELTPKTGIPKYGEAVTRAQATVETLAGGFSQISDLMGRLTQLASETSKPDSEYIALLRGVSTDLRDVINNLRAQVGPAGSDPPSDVKKALKGYADACITTGAALEDLVARVDRFSTAFPIVQEHENWTTQVPSRVFSQDVMMQVEVAGILQDMGRSLSKIRLEVLGVIDSGQTDDLAVALTKARRNVDALEGYVQDCTNILASLADSLSSVDPASGSLLQDSREGGLFGKLVDDLNQLKAKFEDLPELKLADVADQLKDDNAVVIECGDQLRVVGFETIWPARPAIPGLQDDDPAETERTFNGDSALCSNILSITSDKAFANVVLVAYEPAAPQQQSPFSPPPARSSLPLASLSKVTTTLEDANFNVEQWNLAESKDPPETDNDLDTIHIFLPPAPPQPPNPFNRQQQPSPMFGDAEREIVQKILDDGGRGIFLASWTITNAPFGRGLMASPYGYNPLLESTFNVRIDNGVRVMNVTPDPRTANAFFINALRFSYMPLIGYADHPVTSPMQGTRSLADSAAPVLVLDGDSTSSDGATTQPASSDISYTTLLEIPDREEYISADIDSFIQIANEVNSSRGDGALNLGRPLQRGPFKLMVACEKPANEDRTTRVIVAGLAACFADQYLNNKVPVSLEQFRSESEPSENLDLLLNSIYWLNETPELIGRGPVPVPRIERIPTGSRGYIQAFFWAIWPAVVLAPGLFLWFMRRR